MTFKDLHANIEISSTLLNGVHVGEVSQIAQMNLLETDAHTDKAFSVASIDVSSAMILAHVIDLGEVVLKQSGHEAHHAGIGSAGCSIEHQRLNPKPGLLR